MDLNAGLNMARSYYAATAAPFAACPPLTGEAEADLVVVGSHRPVMSDYLLGSNAKTIVRHALCSVLVVRE